MAKKEIANDKKIEIRVLNQYYQLAQTKSRIVLFRGGTRSGKTVAIIQWLIYTMIAQKIDIVIVVHSLRKAKKNILKDLEEWIEKFGLSSKFEINKTDYTYTYVNKSQIAVIPGDDVSRFHGQKADVFFINEATYIDQAIFEQIQWRLPDRKDFQCKIICDYNPSNPYSWVRNLENSNPPGGVSVFTSTYKDNPYLGPNQKKTIEDLQFSNMNKYLIYALGQFSEVRGAIFKNWSTCDKFPETEKVYYGMDFGYANDPTTLVKVTLFNDEIYCHELVYQKGLTNLDIVKIFQKLNISPNTEIIADSASPDKIEEIRRFGYNIRGVIKMKDSIQLGIDVLQRYKINITKSSKNMQDEIINWTWTENKSTGEFINTPVKGWDHALDALRYVAMEFFMQTKSNDIDIW